MRSFIVAALLLGFSITASAQAPTLQWQKAMGGTADDDAISVVPTADGGVVFAGNTGSSDGDVSGHRGAVGINDGWLVKLKADHTIEWQHTLGGTLDDVVSWMIATADGGYAMVGYSGSSDGDFTSNAGIYDGYIAKFDAQGNKTWIHSFGGQLYDKFYSLQQTADGGYIVCGSSESTNGDLRQLTHFGGLDAWVVKFSSTGTVEWQKTFGGTDDDEAFDIRQTTDGGYIFVGSTYSTTGVFAGNHGSSDLWVVKLNATGTAQWQKLFGGTDDDEGEVVIPTSDNGYVIAGSTLSFDGDAPDNHSILGIPDAWLVKLDQSGTKVWSKCYGGTDDDAASDVIETLPDHGLVFCGYASSFDGDVGGTLGPPDGWIVKTDAAGTIQWQSVLGGGDSDVVSYVVQSGLGVMTAGTSVSANLSGTTNHGGFDAWVASVTLSNGVRSTSAARQSALAYPNPFSRRTTIMVPDAFLAGAACTVSLYNTLGIEVIRTQSVVTNGGVVIDRGSLPAGVYECRIVSGSGSVRTSVVITN